MQKLGGLIGLSVKSKSNLAMRVEASLVVEFANQKLQELWGKKGGEQAKAVSLKSFVLTFHCANAIMAQELRLKQNFLLNAVNSRFGGVVTKKIKTVQKGIEVDPEI
ncbi:MAG: DciA family protein [Parcubacteria group bacterium]